MRFAITLLGLLLANLVHAQEFKPFKVNLSTGYARPSGSGAGGGILLSLEPKYGISDQFDLGFRWENALMGRRLVVPNGASQTEIGYAGSYILTGTYLLSLSNTRPYLGVGTGLYSTISGTVSANDGSVQNVGGAGGHKLGGMVRAGVKLGHLNLGAEYNFVPATAVSTTNLGLLRGNNSYLGVKIGFDIGGGFYE